MALRLITKKPPGIITLIVAELILAFTSIGGGAELVRDPSGKSLGVQLMIPYLPFNLQDFTLAGVWLITVFGILPIILAAGLWFGKKWAWVAGLGLGAVLFIWILVEIFLFYSFGFTFFYPLYVGISGLTIIVLNVPSTRKYFVKDRVPYYSE